MEKRRSGILLPVTALPSPCGIGDLGPAAYQFADFLQQAGQRVWQILPLNPTHPFRGNSPYDSTSVFAFNPLLISPELMARDGLIEKSDVDRLAELPADRVDYPSVTALKNKLFDRAFQKFESGAGRGVFDEFCARNAYWLEDFALFMILKPLFSEKAWYDWPPEIRDRDPAALKKFKTEHHRELQKTKFLQYLFLKQWSSLRDYCKRKGIRIFGDVAIYVARDGTDLWSHPEIFKLDKEKRPTVVAGVPPDYFSKTGQLWGNPIYNWDRLKETGFDWWIRRLGHNLDCFDWVRLDHFRGFVACWEVPASHKTAEHGQWVKAPATEFFQTVKEKFPNADLVAEDLGHITPDVREIMERYGFAGMKVLVFAFDGDLATNPYAPHNHVEHCVLYTGTHDCNTVRGWFENEAGPDVRKNLFEVLGREFTVEEISGELIRLAMTSVADTVIFPLQDILHLGQEARMNRPGQSNGNWEWRVLPEQLTAEQAGSLFDLTKRHRRI